MLLYGYGSYEISVDPAFTIPRLSLLDRGVVYVTAHIRGGGEMGRQWYENGKLLAKRNTFTDSSTPPTISSSRAGRRTTGSSPAAAAPAAC